MSDTRIFEVMVEGRDFPGRMMGEPGKRAGFFTTCWVAADNAEHAIETALDSVRGELADHTPAPVPDEQPPTLHVEDVRELDAMPDQTPDTGATWFAMK